MINTVEEHSTLTRTCSPTCHRNLHHDAPPNNAPSPHTLAAAQNNTGTTQQGAHKLTFAYTCMHIHTVYKHSPSPMPTITKALHGMPTSTPHPPTYVTSPSMHHTPLHLFLHQHHHPCHTLSLVCHTLHQHPAPAQKKRCVSHTTLCQHMMCINHYPSALRHQLLYT